VREVELLEEESNVKCVGGGAAAAPDAADMR